MYVGANNLGALGGGPGEWKGVSDVTGWQQADVDARWAAIGQKPPAPLVPATMIGWANQITRGPRMLKVSPATKNLAELKKAGIKWTNKGWRGLTREENDFLNFFYKVAADPYRKQSGISKVAGGILQVASVAIPAMSYFTAVAEAGNAALAYGKQGGDQKLAERVMTPAFEAQAAKEDAKAKADFDAQLDKLKALAPVVPPMPAQLALTAQPVDLAPKPASSVAKKGWSTTEISVAAILGGVILLGVVRR